MLSDEFDEEAAIPLSHRVLSQIEVHAYTSKVTGNTSLQVKFRGDDGEQICTRYPRWLIDTELEQRRCNRTHRAYLASTKPVCILYVTNRGIIEDCTLTPANLSQADFQKLLTLRNQNSFDCVLDTRHKPQLITKPFGIQPLIGGEPNRVIETLVTNAASESERYLAWFAPAVWDKLAKSVYDDYIVTLKGCIAGSLDKCKTISIGNYKFYVSQGGWILDEKELAPRLYLSSSHGWISSCKSIELRHTIDFLRIHPERLILPTYDDVVDYERKMEREYERMRSEVDDYEPSLSDFYDDLEELELNTRGDGYD